MRKLLFAAAFAALLTAGCQTASSTRTETVNGTTTTDTIQVKSFLASITSGKYATTNATGSRLLSVDAASPDQQAIATLSGGIVELAKIAIPLLAKAPTNAAPAVTNAPDINAPAK